MNKEVIDLIKKKGFFLLRISRELVTKEEKTSFRGLSVDYEGWSTPLRLPKREKKPLEGIL